MGADYLASYADSGLYTMQGRLSPPEDGRFQSFPRAGWQTEIAIGAAGSIEGNRMDIRPLRRGRQSPGNATARVDSQIRLRQSGVSVVSICADYFMDCPLVRVRKALTWKSASQNSKWLISICPELGITQNRPAVRRCLEDLQQQGFRGCVVRPQSSPGAGGAMRRRTASGNRSGSAEFQVVSGRDQASLVKVNYDSGNSGSLGYSPVEEFAAYGDRIGSFHIKDRILGGGTVALGTGDVDFASLRTGLIDIDYKGDFVLQVARGEAGDELNWLRRATVHGCRLAARRRHDRLADRRSRARTILRAGGHRAEASAQSADAARRAIGGACVQGSPESQKLRDDLSIEPNADLEADYGVTRSLRTWTRRWQRDPKSCLSATRAASMCLSHWRRPRPARTSSSRSRYRIRWQGLDELWSMVRARKLVCYVGYNFRFHPGLIRMKELIDSGFVREHLERQGRDRRVSAQLAQV